jgi:cell division protein FtsL
MARAAAATAIATPAARTAPAARSAARRARSASAARQAPAAPRRSTAHARPATGRRAKAGKRPVRRMSGPAIPAGARAGGGSAALPIRLGGAPFARALRNRTGGVLDALLSGRAWIVLVGVLLVGIVFFNVDLLRMNREIAITAEKSSVLKRDNARLRQEAALLGSSQRIQDAAGRLGLVLPAAGDVRYLKAHPGFDARRAARLIVAPTGEAPVPTATTIAPSPVSPVASTTPTTTTETPTAPTDTTATPDAAATGATTTTTPGTTTATAPPATSVTPSPTTTTTVPPG